MFADSFCDSGWSDRSHRGWTTLVCFALQALGVGCLLLLPLLYTQGLPRLALLAPLPTPAPPPALPLAPRPPNSSSAAQRNLVDLTLLSPSQIAPRIDTLTESVAR